MKLSFVGKLRLIKVLKYSTLVLLMSFFAGAIATNFFGKQAKTEAASVTVSSGDRYFLDGWEMKNDNILGRVAPATDYNGYEVTIDNNASVRFDHSRNGFSGNPLFATVNGDFTISPRDTTGTTSLASLTIEAGSSITNTPLDFLYNGDGALDQNHPYGIRYTGFYYNPTSIPDLQIGAMSDDGVKISAYVGGSEVVLYDYYSNHATAFDPTKLLTSVNYVGGTYLPIKIDYYNADTAAAFALAVRTSSGSPGTWAVPSRGATSLGGRFFTGPSDAYTEGLVADYYTENLKDKKYNPSDNVNAFTSFGDLIFDNKTDNFPTTGRFSMRNFRFSYVTQRYHYINTVDTSSCYISTATTYTIDSFRNAYFNCGGRSGPFIHTNGVFRGPSEDPLLAAELYRLEPGQARPDSPLGAGVESDSSDSWYGGRSRIRIEIAGALIIRDNSAIDAKATGWPGGPNALKGPGGVVNELGSNTHVYARGLGRGGGWLNYWNDARGVPGGGSFGGYGVASESPYYDYPRHKYGADRGMEMEQLGSGGGNGDHGSRQASGGGLIIIRAGSMDLSDSAMITASGGDCAGDHCGSGSGGGIHLSFTSGHILDGEKIRADGGHTLDSDSGLLPNNLGNGGGGRIWIENASYSIPRIRDITARRGCNEYIEGTCTVIPRLPHLPDNPVYFHEDGTVVIDSGLNSRGQSIKKWLEPISRNGQANTDFNPYALYAGDVIQVNLRVEDLTNTTVISDEPLRQRISGTSRESEWVCAPQDDTSNFETTRFDNEKVEWDISRLRDVPDSQTFSYQCKIEKND